MRKPHVSIEQFQTSPATASSQSWIPTAPFELVTLDPARWSQRKQQAHLWQLIDRLNRERTLH
jgi:hypothetical protein